MEKEIKNRGRKKKYIDISLLEDADHVSEAEAAPLFLSCSICGSTKDIAAFRNKHICMKCLNYIKGRKRS
ncbi:MAG: hypothetical protein Q4C14_08155 [Bacillota bacterium]|nr:hypothetical protein [Bacillota bacterium]